MATRRKMGRPLIPYDQEIADRICERIAVTELGLEEVLAELSKARKRQKKAIPSLSVIYRWLRENKDFQKQSAQARTFQAQLLHDRAQRYAREALIGRIVRREKSSDGVKTIETVSDNVERSKLLVQTTLRRAGQLDPKKYGEKVALTDPSGQKPAEFRWIVERIGPPVNPEEVAK